MHVGTPTHGSWLQVRVGERLLSAEHVLVAVGGTPLMPDFPGAELCLTSDSFFEIKARPRRGQGQGWGLDRAGAGLVVGAGAG